MWCETHKVVYIKTQTVTYSFLINFFDPFLIQLPPRKSVRSKNAMKKSLSKKTKTIIKTMSRDMPSYAASSQYLLFFAQGFQTVSLHKLL